MSAAPDMLDTKDEDGYTALHLAVIAGNTPLLKLLLSKGADVNCLDNEGHSAVHWATGRLVFKRIISLLKFKTEVMF